MFLEQVVDQISPAQNSSSIHLGVHAVSLWLQFSGWCQDVPECLCIIFSVANWRPRWLLGSNMLIFLHHRTQSWLLSFIYLASSFLLIEAMFFILFCVNVIFWDGPGMEWGLKTGDRVEGKGLGVSKRVLPCNPRLIGVSELILSVCLSCLLKACSGTSSCFWLLWYI